MTSLRLFSRNNIPFLSSPLPTSILSSLLAEKIVCSKKDSLFYQQRRYSKGYAKIIDPERGYTKINGYYEGGFYLNNVQVPGSVLAFQDIYMMWRPRRIEEVTKESLIFLELVKPLPEILLLGYGLEKPKSLSKELTDYLNSINVSLELVDSLNATGLYNILSEEGRPVVAALLAPNPDKPIPESFPESETSILDLQFGKNNI
mmetsp:Transcript_7311/g.14418  ORF Transcript_7311/g.14418 Transcript_7311/m.14418 type:complete len:203 (-) Transcript_7311:96-704(-)